MGSVTNHTLHPRLIRTTSIGSDLAGKSCSTRKRPFDGGEMPGHQFQRQLPMGSLLCLRPESGEPTAPGSSVTLPSGLNIQFMGAGKLWPQEKQLRLPSDQGSSSLD